MKYLMTIIIFALLTLNLSATENIWIKQAGKKLVIGAVEQKGIIEFNDENLGLFCQRAEQYLKNLVVDYQKYKCAENNDISKNLCKFIKKTIKRSAVGDNDFATHLQDSQNFVFYNSSHINWSYQKELIAKKYHRDTRDILIAHDRGKTSSSWNISNTGTKGLFLQLMTILNYEHEISPPPRPSSARRNRQSLPGLRPL